MLTVDLVLGNYSITMTEEEAKAKGVNLCSLKEIFSKCNVITNHLANNEKTVGIINRDLLFSMQDYTTFINTGRGAQVVEADLIEALKEQPDRTAVLDVTMPEPPEENHPFYNLPNVFLTPHIAGSAGDECMRMGDYMLEEAERFLNGEELKYSVSLKMLETMA